MLLNPKYTLILHFVIYSQIIAASKVKWLPNASFKIPANFKDGKLPCSKQTVVFPETIVGSIKIGNSDVNELILPEEGELILEGTLNLGEKPADTDCKDGNSYYIDKTSSAWNQADVWTSPKFNKATPDALRIPCFNDYVEFPKDAKITVILPYQTQYIKGLHIGNQTFTTEEFKVRVLIQSEESQQFVLNEVMDTGLLINEHMPCTKFGCPCQVTPLEVDCSVKFCPKALCLNPIKPIGFCCEICGGYISIELDEAFDMKSFNTMVDNIIYSYGKDTVEYHIGFVPELPVKSVQLVVVDKGEYEGSSAEIINSISHAIHDGWFKGEKVALISGGPLSKAGLGWKIFVSMFFAVVLAMGAIYVYYYKMPGLTGNWYLNVNRRANVFTRYQRRTDSIVSLTRRDSAIRASTRSGTAFRNPMYDSVRGRVQVTESVEEES